MSDWISTDSWTNEKCENPKEIADAIKTLK